MRDLRDEEKGRSQSQDLEGKVIEVAHRLVPRLESLPSAPGEPEIGTRLDLMEWKQRSTITWQCIHLDELQDLIGVLPIGE
jgi:hypothetical protein